MRIIFSCFYLAALGLAQNGYMVEGNLIGGPTKGLSVEIAGSAGTRFSTVPVNSDSSFRIEIPNFGQMIEFRILNLQGDVLQVIHHLPQRGVPIELRLNAVNSISSPQAAISLKRLSFHPAAKQRRALAQAQRFKADGRRADSTAALQEIVKTEPEWFEAWVELGMGQASSGENAAAADSLGRALAIDPNAAEIYPILGFVLFQSGQVQEAGQIASKGLELRPDSLRCKYVLGLVLASAPEPVDRAVALLEEAQSEFPAAMLPLAGLLLRMGQFEACRDTAWRYLHGAKTPRGELATAIWIEASQSLRLRATK